ncbi:MAG: hypothetical protein ACLPXB_00550 [Thiobacillaceae bacterium]
MRPTRLWLVVVLSSCLAAITLAQTTGSSSVQAVSVLRNAYSALVGKSAVNDVTLTGTVERIVGGDGETGSVTYKAVAGSNRLDLSFSSETISEIRSTTVTGVSGSWIDSDGVSHPMAGHNVMTDVGWFPLFAIGSFTASPNSVLSYVGPETHDGLSVIHVAAWQLIPVASGTPPVLPQHLSQMDFYLDPTTLLPLAIAFDVHPDTNALMDIPIEIHFSDYRTINGVPIPFHVQKFLNNGLFLDIQFQNAVINSGLTASSITN